MTKFMQIRNGQVVSLSEGHAPSFFTGLDASKSSNPGKGDTYYATDTFKQYICYVEGLWSLVYSPTHRLFLNDSGAINNNTRAILTGSGVAVTDSSIPQMMLTAGQTGGVATDGAATFQTLDSIPVGSGAMLINIRLGGSSIGNGSAGISDIFLGLCNDFTQVAPTNGLYFNYDRVAAVWRAVRRVNSSGYNVEIPALSSGDLLTIYYTDGIAIFKVNGVNVTSTFITNVPASNIAMFCGCSVATSGTNQTSSTGLNVIYMSREVSF